MLTRWKVIEKIQRHSVETISKTISRDILMSSLWKRIYREIEIEGKGDGERGARSDLAR